MLFRLGPFKKTEKGEVQGFKGWTEVQPRSKHDVVKINLIVIKIQI